MRAGDWRGLQQHLDDRRRQEDVRDSIVLQFGNGAIGHEIAHDHHAATLRQCGEADVGAGDMEQRHDDHHGFAGIVGKSFDPGDRAQELAVIAIGQHRALGLAGGAAGIELKHGVVGGGFG